MIIVLNWLILIMTFGLVQVADVEYIDNDTPIVELNNNSLNDVFDTGNLFDINNYQQNSTFPQRSNIDGVIKHEIITPNSSSNFIGVVSSVGFANNDRLYFNYEVKSFENNDRVRHYTRAYYSPYTNLITGEWNHVSSKNYFSASTADDRIVINQAGGVNGAKTAGEFVYFRNVYIVNITNLGIDNNIAVDVLDDYHALYIKQIAYDYDYTLNTLDMTHITIIVGSFFLWTWLYKFLKGVIL